MKFIKNIIFFFYLNYIKYFPIERGKHFVGRLLDKLFGTFIIQVSSIKLEVFASSGMDLSYFKDKNDGGHLILINEINKLDKGNTFIDIGANNGFISFLAAQKVGTKGKVFSFEPSFREYKRLINGINLNDFDNIVPYNIAISNLNGFVNISTNNGHTGLNRIRTNQENDKIDSNDKPLIPCFKLSYILNIEKIDLIKIDVEGAEFQVLLGLSEFLEKRIIRKVIIEITPKFLELYGDNKNNIYELLYKFNYISTINSTEWQYDEIFILNN